MSTTADQLEKSSGAFGVAETADPPSTFTKMVCISPVALPLISIGPATTCPLDRFVIAAVGAFSVTLLTA